MWKVFDCNQKHQNAPQQPKSAVSGIDEGFVSNFGTAAAQLNHILQEKKEIVVYRREDIKVGKLLGKGSFSKVYEVSHIKYRNCLSSQEAHNIAQRSETVSHYQKQHTGYAVKRLRKSLLKSDKFTCAATDLMNEARFLALLDHDYIVKIHGLASAVTCASCSGRHNDFFLVIDQLQYTLDQRLRQWPTIEQEMFPEEILVLKTKFSLQIAQALAYIHENGMIYRDLKPKNIGFKNEDTIALFDFGCCRELPQQGNAGDECFQMSMAGTLKYMAPEIFNTRRYNAKADVYSWAIVFYQMLTMKTLYPGYDIALYEKFVCRLGERPNVSSVLPRSLKKILAEAWVEPVSERLTMKSVCEKLQKILDNSHDFSCNFQGFSCLPLCNRHAATTA